MKTQSMRLLSRSSRIADDTDLKSSSSDRFRVLDSIFAKWDAGTTADALKEIGNHPELAQERSFVLELAAEEFWRRNDSDGIVSVDDFVEKFTGFETSLRRLLRFQGELLGDNDRPTSATWPKVDDVFRGFRLLEIIGSGAFSQVFLAADVELSERLVVVKVTKMPGNEPAALGRLNHPNIVPVLSYSSADFVGPASLVMPYLGRSTLEDLLALARIEKSWPVSSEPICRLLPSDDSRNSPQPESHDENPFRGVDWVESILQIGLGIASGLAHAHEHKLLHLDIKPSNILLARNGRPNLLDFNLTRFADLDQKLLGGTAPYMSPEQIEAVRRRGDSADRLNERSDLYSLGVLLYELLTGRHPFGPLDSRTPFDELLQILSERQAGAVVPIRELNRTVNASCSRLIESCLRFDPVRRPNSAKQLIAAIQEELRSAPRVRRAALRHPKRTRVIVAGTVVLAVGLTFGAVRLPSSEDRNFVNAVLAAHADRPQEVVELTSASIASDGDNRTARLLRASALIRLEKIDEALQEYQSLATKSSDPSATSGLIYCLSSVEKFTDALALKSLRQTGKLLAADLNNLAYCHLRVREYEQARELLDRAITLDPDSGILHYNRAFTEIERASRDAKYLPVVGLNDLELAINRLGRKGELLYNLIFLKAMMNRKESDADVEMAAVLAEAVTKGIPINKAAVNPFLARLTRRNDFRTSINGVPVDESRLKADRLIPPPWPIDK